MIISQTQDYFKNYYIINREKICEKRRINYHLNPEKHIKRMKKYHILTYDKRKEYYKNYYLILKE
jgi:hypothetical protein